MFVAVLDSYIISVNSRPTDENSDTNTVSVIFYVGEYRTKTCYKYSNR